MRARAFVGKVDDVVTPCQRSNILIVEKVANQLHMRVCFGMLKRVFENHFSKENGLLVKVRYKETVEFADMAPV